MKEKQIKILTATVFVAVALLSLLLTIKNGNYSTLPKIQHKSVEYTGGLSNLNPLERNIVDQLREIGVPDSAIKSSFMIETESKEISVLVPNGKPMEEIIQALQGTCKKTAYALEDSYYSGKNDRARLIFNSSRKSEEDIILHLRRARNGYFRKNSSMVIMVSGLDTTAQETRLRYLNFTGMLNYVIPSWTDELDSIAVVLQRYESPFILQLPLESNGATKPSLYTLRIDDSQSSIATKLSELMRRAPNAQGIAAEGGDLFLETRTVTRSLFAELNKRNLLFFDTRKGSQQRARSIANHKGVPYIRSNRKLKAKSAEELTLELKRLCHTAEGRKELTIWGEASAELITALENSTNYFEKIGVTLKEVTTLSN